jgi:hypothetical protein
MPFHLGCIWVHLRTRPLRYFQDHDAGVPAIAVPSPVPFRSRFPLLSGRFGVIDVVTVITVRGENMITTAEETETAQATAASDQPKAAKKAHVAKRARNVASSKPKSGKKASPAKKAPKGAKKARGARAGKAAKEKGVAREGSKTETILEMLKRPAAQRPGN